MSLPPVGAQLIVFGPKYSVEDDTNAILDCVAAAGYNAVEGGPKDAAAYRKKLEDRGLVFGGSHTGLAGLVDPKPIIDYLHALDSSDLCNSGLMSWDKRGPQDYREGIRIMNEAGKTLRSEGIHLHYHNHAWEFEKVDGDKRGIDFLIDGLDPECVDLCVDVAWVLRGEDDPVSFLLKHKEIVGYLHFKDHDGEDWIELGQGQVDFDGIMKILPELTNARWVMIEQDTTKIDPMDSCRISREYLRDTFDY